MALIKKELDKIRRDFMAKEIKMDIAKNRLKPVECLNHSGNIEFPDILMNSAVHGDEKSMAQALKDKQCMRVYNAVADGNSVSLKRVSDQHYTEFSERTFNKYYLRGLCREAVDCGCDNIVLKDESTERVYGSMELLKALRDDVELEDIVGKDSEKRTFKAEYKV